MRLAFARMPLADVAFAARLTNAKTPANRRFAEFPKPPTGARLHRQGSRALVARLTPVMRKKHPSPDAARGVGALAAAAARCQCGQSQQAQGGGRRFGYQRGVYHILVEL